MDSQPLGDESLKLWNNNFLNSKKQLTKGYHNCSVYSLKNSTFPSIKYQWLGTVPYLQTWNYQQQLHSLRVNSKIDNTVLLLEHTPVYTFGKNANHNHLLPSYSKTADVVQVDRGGDITYHGPGQLVVYPIIDLHDYKLSVSWYISSIENTIIRTLKEYNIIATKRDGLTGVWVGDEKIAAIGVRLSRWVTMHGFALNLNPNMKFYDGIIPCGIFEYGVTSITEQIDKQPTLKELADVVIYNFLNEIKNI